MQAAPLYRYCEYAAQCPACAAVRTFADEPPLLETIITCRDCQEAYVVRGIALAGIDPQAIYAAARELVEAVKVRHVVPADVATATARLETLLEAVHA